MIDILGGIFGAVVYVVVVVVLVGFSPPARLSKLVLFVAAAGWAGIIIAVDASGGFAPGATGPVPAPVIAFAVLFALLFGSWFLVPRFRSALLSLPLPALVGLNAVRLGGAFFLLLAAEGRLSNPFAASAGWGDVATAALAIPLAFMAARGDLRPGWVSAWNAFGALDLTVAILLGLLSAEGTPFRVFTDDPGILALTALPWVMVPAMLVPFFLLIHLTIAAKLRSVQPMTQAAAMAR